MAHILLVDDNEGVRTSLEVLLNFSHLVESASNAKDALYLLESKKYDCVISDIKMPGMSGIDLLKTISRIQSDLPVILISGHSDIRKDEVFKLGARGILWKPFEIADLEKMIKETVEQSL